MEWYAGIVLVTHLVLIGLLGWIRLDLRAIRKAELRRRQEEASGTSSDQASAEGDRPSRRRRVGYSTEEANWDTVQAASRAERFL